jgi:hypothetical protein
VSPNVDIDAQAESPDPHAMLLADLADFVIRHRPCGRLTGDATEPVANGYMVTAGLLLRCRRFRARSALRTRWVSVVSRDSRQGAQTLVDAWVGITQSPDPPAAAAAAGW